MQFTTHLPKWKLNPDKIYKISTEQENRKNLKTACKNCYTSDSELEQCVYDIEWENVLVHELE